MPKGAVTSWHLSPVTHDFRTTFDVSTTLGGIRPTGLHVPRYGIKGASPSCLHFFLTVARGARATVLNYAVPAKRLHATTMSRSSLRASSIVVAASAYSVYMHAIRLQSGQPICSQTCGASSVSDRHVLL